MKQPAQNRRDFIKKNALAGSALFLPKLPFPTFMSDTPKNTDKGLEVFLFSKHLQFLNYSDMAEATKEMGFNGLDLTVRPKGHVEPEKVVDELPRVSENIQKYGLKPGIMTTNITSANDNVSLQVLQAAAGLGITHYRTGWLKYPEDETISESQKQYQKEFGKLQEINEQLGIVGCYQNHAGNHVGAPIWDIPYILPETANGHMGCQYDIRHAVVEGGTSWELGLRYVKHLIKSIVIKDFKWGKTKGEWKPINTPLGEGMVDFKKYFALLKEYKINVPISLHCEYDLGGAEHGSSTINIDQKEVFKKINADLVFLKETWEKAS